LLKRIISAVKRVKLIRIRMPYVIVRGHRCRVIVLNVHAPTEDAIDAVKEIFYEELQRVLDNSLNAIRKFC
jgi:hypothetical protein